MIFLPVLNAKSMNLTAALKVSCFLLYVQYSILSHGNNIILKDE